MQFLLNIGCGFGSFIALSLALYLSLLLQHTQILNALSYFIMFLLIPGWMLGFGVMMVNLGLNGQIKIVYCALINFILSAIVSAPLKYVCFLFPEIVRWYNPMIIAEDFKITDEHFMMDDDQYGN
jgi:hypothetical protein